MDRVQQKLCEILATQGRSLCEDPQRCEDLLRDLGSEHEREISILIRALREGVAADLIRSQGSVPSELLLGKWTQRLQDNLALPGDVARWAVESWALALGRGSPVTHRPHGTKPVAPPERTLSEILESSGVRGMFIGAILGVVAGGILGVVIVVPTSILENLDVVIVAMIVEGAFQGIIWGIIGALAGGMIGTVYGLVLKVTGRRNE